MYGPVGHRLDTWGVINNAAYIYLVIVYVLDDQEDVLDLGGFGDSFHEGIVPPMEYLEHLLNSTVCLSGSGLG
jgi:hypothetical protein